MSINKYNNSIFAKFIDINGTELEDLANNLYNKIKYKGILAETIDRNRDEETEIETTSNDSITASLDSDFTWGNCLEFTGSESVEVSGVNSIGRTFDIQFEIKPQSATFEIDLFNGQITIDESGIAYDTISSYSFTQDTFYKVKISRNRKEVNVYVNDTLENTYNLASDDEFNIETNIIESTSNSCNLSNLKITQAGYILHWWKLNNYVEI